MAHSRIGRLQAMLKDDLDRLPDLPAGVPEVEKQQTNPVQRESDNSPHTAKSPDSFDADQRQSTEIQSSEKHDEKRFVWLTGPGGQDSTSSPATQTATSSRPPLDLQYGSVGPFEESYCPIVEVSKYCYKYIRGPDTQRVASAFFDAGKFWDRSWDIFFVRHPDTNTCIGLVTESQLKSLLQEINTAFHHLDLKIDSWQREHGLVTKFPRHPDTHPRYLGRSWSKAEYTRVMENAPGYGFHLPAEDKLPSPDDRSLEAFKAKIDDMVRLQKAKGKAAKERKIQQTTIANKSMTQQLKRTQRYLGLLVRNKDDSSGESQPVTQPKKELPAIDVNKPVPYPFELGTVIISIDVESYERDHSKITEVGICTLDTLELKDIAPGANGENWRTVARNRHIRINEHKHFINSDFVDGCPGNFEYGQSEFVALREIPGVLRAAFSPPYSKNLDPTSTDDFPPLSISSNVNDTAPAQRNIILLGHNPDQDITYFHRLGFNPLSIPSSSPDRPGLLEVIDTAALYRTYSRLPQDRKLGTMLAEFDIDGWFCHNAGNDAVYTMHAMLAIAVKDAAERGDEELRAKRAATVEARIQEELQDQEDIKRAAVAAYEDAEGGDGGVPLSPSDVTGSGTDLARGVAGLVLDGGCERESSLQTGDAHRGGRGSRGGRRGRGRAFGRTYPAPYGRGKGYLDRDTSRASEP